MKTILFAVFLLAQLSGASARPDSSGSSALGPAREWKDDAGRIIRRVDPSGRMTLLTYDSEGRVFRIDQLLRRVDPSEKEPTIQNGGAWVHRFLWGEGGLSAEIDCTGRRHDFAEAQALDPRKGTAQEGHRHSLSTAARPTRESASLYEYDSQGRILPGGTP